MTLQVNNLQVLSRNNVCPQWMRYSQHLLGSMLCLVFSLAASNFHLDTGLLLREVRRWALPLSLAGFGIFHFILAELLAYPSHCFKMCLLFSFSSSLSCVAHLYRWCWICCFCFFSFFFFPLLGNQKFWNGRILNRKWKIAAYVKHIIWKMQVAVYVCEGFGIMLLICKTKIFL